MLTLEYGTRDTLLVVTRRPALSCLYRANVSTSTGAAGYREPRGAGRAIAQTSHSCVHGCERSCAHRGKTQARTEGGFRHRLAGAGPNAGCKRHALKAEGITPSVPDCPAQAARIFYLCASETAGDLSPRAVSAPLAIAPAHSSERCCSYRLRFGGGRLSTYLPLSRSRRSCQRLRSSTDGPTETCLLSRR